MPRKILIDTDTDTASDDAVALIMALRSPLVEVLGITVVAGNIGVEQATRNALLTVEICGATVPVYMGAAKPLEQLLHQASWFHGMDGLGDVGYTPANSRPHSQHAVDAILTRGMTVVDRLNVTGDDRNRDLWHEMRTRSRKVKICWKLDVPGWKAALKQALR